MLLYKEGLHRHIREHTPEIAAIMVVHPSQIGFNRGMIRDLSLDNTRITTLPPRLYIGRDLSLDDTRITALPAVGGDLRLDETQIKALSPGLHVGLDLSLDDTRIAAGPPCRW